MRRSLSRGEEGELVFDLLSIVFLYKRVFFFHSLLEERSFEAFQRCVHSEARQDLQRYQGASLISAYHHIYQVVLSRHWLALEGWAASVRFMLLNWAWFLGFAWNMGSRVG